MKTHKVLDPYYPEDTYENLIKLRCKKTGKAYYALTEDWSDEFTAIALFNSKCRHYKYTRNGTWSMKANGGFVYAFKALFEEA